MKTSSIDILEKGQLSGEQAKAILKVLEAEADERLVRYPDRDEMRQEFAAVRQEMRQEFAAVRQEMRDEFAAVRREMRDEFASVRKEIAEQKVSLIKWTFSVMAGHTALLLGVMYALLHSPR